MTPLNHFQRFLNFAVAVLTKANALIQFVSERLPRTIVVGPKYHFLCRWVNMVEIQAAERMVVAAQLALTTEVIHHHRFKLPAMSICHTARTRCFSPFLFAFILKLLLAEVAYCSHTLQECHIAVLWDNICDHFHICLASVRYTCKD
jgi:hypothetical protein